MKGLLGNRRWWSDSIWNTLERDFSFFVKGVISVCWDRSPGSSRKFWILLYASLHACIQGKSHKRVRLMSFICLSWSEHRCMCASAGAGVYASFWTLRPVWMFSDIPQETVSCNFSSLKCSVPFLLPLTSFSLDKLQCEPTIAVSRNNLRIKLRKLKVVEQKKPWVKLAEMNLTIGNFREVP